MKDRSTNWCARALPTALSVTSMGCIFALALGCGGPNTPLANSTARAEYLREQAARQGPGPQYAQRQTEDPPSPVAQKTIIDAAGLTAAQAPILSLSALPTGTVAQIPLIGQSGKLIDTGGVLRFQKGATPSGKTFLPSGGAANTVWETALKWPDGSPYILDVACGDATCLRRFFPKGKTESSSSPDWKASPTWQSYLLPARSTGDGSRVPESGGLQAKKGPEGEYYLIVSRGSGEKLLYRDVPSRSGLFVEIDLEEKTYDDRSTLTLFFEKPNGVPILIAVMKQPEKDDLWIISIPVSAASSARPSS